MSNMNFDYAIITRESPKKWNREDRSTVKLDYLPEHGLFPAYSLTAYATLNALNAEVDKAYAEYIALSIQSHDGGFCPTHGDQDFDIYNGMYGDCTCANVLQNDYWANRNGFAFHKLYQLSDEEALYWMEYGATMMD